MSEREKLWQYIKDEVDNLRRFFQILIVSRNMKNPPKSFKNLSQWTLSGNLNLVMSTSFSSYMPSGVFIIVVFEQLLILKRIKTNGLTVEY